MSDQIRAALRAAIYQAIAVLGESKAREIVNDCFKTMEDDHWGKR